MGKHKIAFFDVTKEERPALERLLETIPETEASFFEDELNKQTLDQAKEADIVSVFITSDITAEVLEKLPKLKLIISRSTGFNHIDMAAAKHRHVTVCNVPTYGENTVAEYAFGLLLSLSRKLPQVFEVTHRGVVEHKGLTGFDLAGKTLGVIGTGRIGLHTIKIGLGFAMKVQGYDPYPNQDAAKELGFTYLELNDLLASSEVVSLHAPLTKDSQHIIDSDSLKHIKTGAIVVNTARGELIDTTALIEALNSGKVAGAALDVLEAEDLMDVEEEIVLLRPGASKKSLELAAEHAILLKMPNVVLSNHNAYNTVEALHRINTTTVDNIKQFLAGTPANVVSE